MSSFPSIDSITLAFWSPGPAEMMVLAVVALLLYGGNLPEVARSWGKSFAEFRRGLSGIQNELNDVIYSKPDYSKPEQLPYHDDKYSDDKDSDDKYRDDAYVDQGYEESNDGESDYQESNFEEAEPHDQELDGAEPQEGSQSLDGAIEHTTDQGADKGDGNQAANEGSASEEKRLDS